MTSTWRDLQEALTEIAELPMVVRPGVDLGGRAELAQVTGARRSSVGRMLTSDGAPPALFHTAATGSVYSITEVMEYERLPRRWRRNSPDLPPPPCVDAQVRTLVDQARWRELEHYFGAGTIARPGQDIAGLAELAKATGRTRDSVRKVLVVRAAHNQPPRPLVHMRAGGYLWSMTEILGWPGPRGRWGPSKPLTESRIRRGVPTPTPVPAPTKPTNWNRVMIP